MRLPLPLLPLALALAIAGCASERAAERSVEARPPPSFPAFLAAPSKLARSPELEEAAALLCARDTNAVIDDDVRRAARVWDGQVAGLLHRGAQAQVRSAVAKDLGPLLAELSATHAGFAEGRLPDGRSCAALVAVRRRLSLDAELPPAFEAGEPFPLALSPLGAGPWRAQLFVLRPDGHVDKRALVPSGPGAGSAFSDVLLPTAGEGRYVLEVVLTREGADDPEIALLWPFVVGAPRLPPAPLVLFPDEGHSDVALSYRLQALVERLRTTQLIDVLSISPQLQRLAGERASSLAAAGRLGHRVPDGRSAAEDLRQGAPAFFFSHLAEVQAQAGTLEEAWTALLESPAHRYELVRTKATHMGAAVRRGEDALGRPLVSVVVLLAKKLKARPAQELEAELLGKLNLARHHLGRGPLAQRASLARVAQRLAKAMAEASALDERALGAPAAELALGEDPALDGVRVVVARLDDPLRLAPPAAALDEETEAAGIGLARGAAEWFLTVLTASVDEEAK